MDKEADLIAHANFVKLQIQAMREETIRVLEVLRSVEKFEKTKNILRFV